MIMEGLRLMVVGMAVVFCFLSLLVMAMNGSALFFKRFAHYFPEAPAPEPGKTTDYAEIAAAIAAVMAAKQKS